MLSLNSNFSFVKKKDQNKSNKQQNNLKQLLVNLNFRKNFALPNVIPNVIPKVIPKVIPNVKNNQDNLDLNNEFILKDKYNSIIPLNLYMCWGNKILPPLMQENYNLMVKNNPEFKHYLYDDDDCRNFIKKSFPMQVLNAFDSLVPGAFKADLWRYCVLYINGGIYLDIKYKCINNFKLIALTEREYFVNDRPSKCMYNALIAVKPFNKIMLNCINRIVKNVKYKVYGPSSLCPTGPGLLGLFFTQNEINAQQLKFTDYKIDYEKTEEFIVYNNKNAILKYYDNYRIEQSKFQKTQHYSILWNNRQIYI